MGERWRGEEEALPLWFPARRELKDENAKMTCMHRGGGIYFIGFISG